MDAEDRKIVESLLKIHEALGFVRGLMKCANKCMAAGYEDLAKEFIIEDDEVTERIRYDGVTEIEEHVAKIYKSKSEGKENGDM